jgi:transposase
MVKNSKLSRYRVEKVAECFCIDIEASKVALLLKLNRKTVNRYFLAFRRLIHARQQTEKALFIGVVEADESYFGPHRVRGRPGPRVRGRKAFSLFALGLHALHKIFAAANPLQVIDFLKQLLSPKLPLNPLKSMPL